MTPIGGIKHHGDCMCMVCRLRRAEVEVERLTKCVIRKEGALTGIALSLQPLHLGHDLITEHGIALAARAAADKIAALQSELDDARAEPRKQWPAITAVFDRAVWDRAGCKP